MYLVMETVTDCLTFIRKCILFEQFYFFAEHIPLHIRSYSVSVSDNVQGSAEKCDFEIKEKLAILRLKR